MPQTVYLTGDINLLGNTDPKVPFAKVGPTLRAADLVISNLECCLHEPTVERSPEAEGFYVPLALGEALREAGIGIIGHANNVTIGGPAIRSTCAELDRLGIAHAGAGIDRRHAYAPVVVERSGTRYGFLQRTSVHWPQDHAALDDYPGVAILPALTAYRPPFENHRTVTRPGRAPEIVTWCERAALEEYRTAIAALRPQCDVLIASNHWGQNFEVLDYMTEIAHTAIDAGADVVMGHGPHFPLPVEIYKGRAIFYALGNLSFRIGHRGKVHPDWLGMVPKLTVEDGRIVAIRPVLVRHNDENETYFVAASDETDELDRVIAASRERGAELTIEGAELVLRI